MRPLVGGAVAFTLPICVVALNPPYRKRLHCLCHGQCLKEKNSCQSRQPSRRPHGGAPSHLIRHGNHGCPGAGQSGSAPGWRSVSTIRNRARQSVSATKSGQPVNLDRIPWFRTRTNCRACPDWSHSRPRCFAATAVRPPRPDPDRTDALDSSRQKSSQPIAQVLFAA